MLTKDQVRKDILKKRSQLDGTFIQKASQSVSEQVLEVLLAKPATVLHSYLPFKNEVDIFPLLDHWIAQGNSVIAPQTLPNRQLKHWVYTGQSQLTTGKFGTSHPATQAYTGPLDVILVPGLAFTSAGDRLGFGAGYYDSFLAQHPEAFTIGIAYDFQILSDLPTEKHDVRLDLVICNR